MQGHQQGKTLEVILDTLQDLDYYTDYRVLNALNVGLPQKTESIRPLGLSIINNIREHGILEISQTQIGAA